MRSFFQRDGVLHLRDKAKLSLILVYQLQTQCPSRNLLNL